jgi:membrane-anchored protein YejM (alkaline phosphatase superfamily)
VWRLTLAFVDIALHRRGPEHLPPSQFLLGLVLLVYVACAVASSLLRAPVFEALQAVLLDALFYLGFIWLLLRSSSRSRRFTQTAAALFGTGSLIALLSIPLFAWSEAVERAPMTLTLLTYGLLVWSVDIGGYILSRALDQPYIVGVLIMVVYVLASVSLHFAFFPSAV